MISSFVAVQCLHKAEEPPIRILLNVQHVVSVEPANSVNGRECLVLMCVTEPALLIYGTLDEWERATGTPASMGHPR